jgi:WD40 repeat protein
MTSTKTINDLFDGKGGSDDALPQINIENSQSQLLNTESDLRDSFTHRGDIINEHSAISFLSGTYSNELTDKEVLALSTRLNMKYCKGDFEKGKRHTGIAPTRFNLSKNRFGKYVARIVFHHNWKSVRARVLWHKLRVSVLKTGDFLDLEEEDELEISRSMIQGFKCQQLLKRPYEIVAICVHPKIPTHCLDGSLGLENDVAEVAKERFDVFEEDENFFDTDTEVKKTRKYSVLSVDSKHNLTTWDINQPIPRIDIKMEHHFSLITFISKHFMYAGLIDQTHIKFFTPKLHITSGVSCGHDIQTLQYFAPKNELIATGIHEVTIWSIDAGIKGDLQISATQRLRLMPKLHRNEWLDLVYILLERKQLWIVSNVHIFIFDYSSGSYLQTIRNVTTRRITCIAQHSEYQYILVGCADGTIKVINIVNATVHEFVSHTKAVIAINVFPVGPLVVSCSNDQTLRLYNLKYFKEICSINIKDRPIGMDLMDDVYLFVRTRVSIQIWATNQFNVNFTTMSSKVTKLLHVADKSKPAKVIARTADGMNRLVSPVSGRVITSNLPLLESNNVIDMAYALSLNRLFILFESGDVWVFRTDQNPCTIVDIWKSDEASNFHLYRV